MTTAQGFGLLLTAAILGAGWFALSKKQTLLGGVLIGWGLRSGIDVLFPTDYTKIAESVP